METERISTFDQTRQLNNIQIIKKIMKITHTFVITNQ